MGQITIRDLDPAVEKKVRSISRQTGKSLNRVIQDLIQQQLGFNSSDKKKPSNSLKKLAGGWSKDETEKFAEAISFFEMIDGEMWK